MNVLSVLFFLPPSSFARECRKENEKMRKMSKKRRNTVNITRRKVYGNDVGLAASSPPGDKVAAKELFLPCFYCLRCSFLLPLLVFLGFFCPLRLYD